MARTKNDPYGIEKKGTGVKRPKEPIDGADSKEQETIDAMDADWRLAYNAKKQWIEEAKEDVEF